MDLPCSAFQKSGFLRRETSFPMEKLKNKTTDVQGTRVPTKRGRHSGGRGHSGPHEAWPAQGGPPHRRPDPHGRAETRFRTPLPWPTWGALSTPRPAPSTLPGNRDESKGQQVPRPRSEDGAGAGAVLCPEETPRAAAAHELPWGSPARSPGS